MKKPNNRSNKKEFKFSDQSNFNFIFLGFTLLTFALVEIISTYYSSSNLAIPKFVGIINIASLIFILLLVGIILSYIKYPKQLKILIFICILSIEAAIIFNMIFSAPSSYIEYDYTCPTTLKNNSKIILSYKRVNNIFSPFNFFTTSNSTRLSFFYQNNLLVKSTPYVIEENNKWYNISIDVIFNKFMDNSVIEINNFFSCGIYHCHLIRILGTDSKCVYRCRNNVCYRIKE